MFAFECNPLAELGRRRRRRFAVNISFACHLGQPNAEDNIFYSFRWDDATECLHLKARQLKFSSLSPFLFTLPNKQSFLSPWTKQLDVSIFSPPRKTKVSSPARALSSCIIKSFFSPRFLEGHERWQFHLSHIFCLHSDTHTRNRNANGVETINFV